jgi:hypothetical protein
MPFFLITGAAAGADRNAYVINRLQAAAAIKRAFMLDLRRERIARLGSFESDTKCPLWVKSAVLPVGRPLPVHPKKQTFSESVGMSQKCHRRKSVDLSIASSKQKASAVLVIV